MEALAIWIFILGVLVFPEAIAAAIGYYLRQDRLLWLLPAVFSTVAIGGLAWAWQDAVVCFSCPNDDSEFTNAFIGVAGTLLIGVYWVLATGSSIAGWMVGRILRS
jgi:hypothetical protein